MYISWGVGKAKGSRTPNYFLPDYRRSRVGRASSPLCARGPKKGGLELESPRRPSASLRLVVTDVANKNTGCPVQFKF